MFLIVSKYLLPPGFNGLTLFPVVLLREKSLADDAVILNHERIHLRQQIELLILPFFVWYGLEFLLRWLQKGSRRAAYFAISFEREAYAHEKDLGYLKSRSFWGFWKFL